jgi:hypothetical protein
MSDFEGASRHLLDELVSSRTEAYRDRARSQKLFYLHLPSLLALQASAKRDCHFCSLMAYGLAYQRKLRINECNLKQIDEVYLYTWVDRSNGVFVLCGAIYCRLWLKETQGKPTVGEFTLL